MQYCNVMYLFDCPLMKITLGAAVICDFTGKMIDRLQSRGSGVVWYGIDELLLLVEMQALFVSTFDDDATWTVPVASFDLSSAHRTSMIDSKV